MLYLCTRFRGTAVLNKTNDKKFDAKSEKIKKKLNENLVVSKIRLNFAKNFRHKLSGG